MYIILLCFKYVYNNKSMLLPRDIYLLCAKVMLKENRRDMQKDLKTLYQLLF